MERFYSDLFLKNLPDQILLFAGNALPNPAQRGALNSKIGRDMVQRYVIENVGVGLNQIEVALFGCFEQKILRSADGNIEGFLCEQAPETFPLMRLPVEFIQVFQTDSQHERIRHGLRVVIAGRLLDETFERHDKLVLRIQKNVFFLARFPVDNIGPEHPVHDEAQVFANGFVPVEIIAFVVADGLPAGQGCLEVRFSQSGKCVQGMLQQVFFVHRIVGFYLLRMSIATPPLPAHRVSAHISASPR